jgi:hypothetical protein
MERRFAETEAVDNCNVGLELYRRAVLRFAMTWTHEMQQSKSLHGASRLQELKYCGFSIVIFRKATKSIPY